ncbi:MAG: hypothetical protein ACI37O_04300 [Candidatus Avelusimicrobium sp.]|uniref:hypothetical protein n=1 Tax=Candidatus Avelusimicrobium sp. TaxID=3048833 RepID=UPI003F059402
MSEHKSIELNNLDKSVANSYGGSVRCYTASFNMADIAAAKDDTLFLCVKPQGGVFLAATVCTSATLGTATLAINGQTEAGEVSAGKYAAARTLTTPNQPVLFGDAGKNEQTVFEEKITASVGTAALPTSGELVFTVYVGVL